MLSQVPTVKLKKYYCSLGSQLRTLSLMYWTTSSCIKTTESWHLLPWTWFIYENVISYFLLHWSKSVFNRHFTQFLSQLSRFCHNSHASFFFFPFEVLNHLSPAFLAGCFSCPKLHWISWRTETKVVKFINYAETRGVDRPTVQSSKPKSQDHTIMTMDSTPLFFWYQNQRKTT